MAHRSALSSNVAGSRYAVRPAGWVPSDDRRDGETVRPTLVAVALAGVSSLAAVFALTASGTADAGWGRVALHVVIVGAPLVTGLYALRTQGLHRFGLLLIGAGFVWSLAVLAEAPASLPYSVGRIVAWALFPLLVFLMLSFPDGRLAGRTERRLALGVTVLVAVGYVATAPLIDEYPPHNPWASCGHECPPNAFQVVSEPAVVGAVVEPARDLLSILLLAGVVGLIAARHRRSVGLRRATAGPVLVVAIASICTLVGFIAVRRVAEHSPLVDILGTAWMLSLPGLAAAFSLGMLNRRLLLGRVLTNLSLALRGTPTGPQVAGAIAAAVDGLDIDVLEYEPVRGRWRFHDGGETADRGALVAQGRVIRDLGDGGGPVAAIAFEEGGETDELIEAIISLADATLRQAELRSELDASLRDLESSRKRIATAADVERRRIERDLHDGAQQRLIALRMRLALAEDLLAEDPQAASRAIHALGDDVDDALDGIRSLAHGIYPPILADRGLADALRSVARHAPLRVEVRAVGLRRHPPDIEGPIYFTCLEALQNALKHAVGATCVTISLRENGAIEVWVVDDGHAPGPLRPGRGIRNMHDRVESLGGSIEVVRSSAGGVAIRAVVPLPAGAASAGDGVADGVPAAMHDGAGEAERQREPVGEQPVGQGGEQSVAG